MGNSKNIELTILMPCLNEAETLETCIEKAKRFLTDNNVNGEVLIADNGSSDGSQEIAQNCGARVVDIQEKGYGAALIGGCNAAYGKYVIMGDADDSYDFLNLEPFVDKLREGYDLVMGNRFRGGIEKGAMPPLHKYLGNPVLSFLGRLFYPSAIKDFHCGLRGYNKNAIQELNLITTGMEYASEMVVKATLHKLKIYEVPTTLSKDGRTRPPHLRSWRDGWRHLKFLLMHSPNWLFLYPSMFCIAVGAIFSITLMFGPIVIDNISFDIHTMLYTVALIIVGINILQLFMFTKIYAMKTKFIPESKSIVNLEKWTMERGVSVGALFFIIGIIASIVALITWKNNSFGALEPTEMMRLTLPALGFILVGVQIIFGSFFIGILNIKHN